METLNLIKNDPWLEPFEDAIKGRHQHVLDKEAELTNKGKQTLSDISDFTVLLTAGFSVNGHPTPQKYLLWAHSMNGKN